LSSDFPTTAGAFQTTNNGHYDVFVTELNPSGTGLLYSTYLGGGGDDIGEGIAMDAFGNAYVAGYTFSSDFPTTAGAFQTTNHGSSDALVTQLDRTGTGLLYSTYLGGDGQDGAHGIAVDTAGNACVTGDTQSGNFPTTAGAFQTTNNGSHDAFVTQLNPVGTGLLYSTYLGGNGDDAGYGIAVGAAGNAYVTGYTESSDFPATAGAFQTTTHGETDVFVTELNPTGSGLLYSTYLGGSDYDVGKGITLDAAGNAYVAGYTLSSDFPTTAGAFQTTNHGNSDALVTQLDRTGTDLLYSTYLGGGSVDFGKGIALDAAGNAYVTGYTISSDFPTTAGAFQTTNNGSSDVFMAKISVSQIVLTASRRRIGETVLVHLLWTGANSTKIDIYRDGVQIAEVRNTGRYNDSLTVSGNHTYEVCEVGGAMSCSNEVSVRGP
jgi:hypothetical protein